MSENRKKTIDVALNRVEGDLELRIEHEDGVVTNAWSKGIMYRGFENMLKGRGALDGLVLTPRVCGICGTAHLLTAAKALDMISGAQLPVNALLVRNLAMMAEHIQSDLRHGILMFMQDCHNPAYASLPLYGEAVRRYQAFKGRSVIGAIGMTKKILEIVAILGGQWPNSSFIVPGGVASVPTFNDIVNCTYIINLFTTWYEEQILGCPLERWQQVRSEQDLQAWLDESDAHRDGDLGFFIRFARLVGLDRLGRGHGNFVSFGQLELPQGSAVRGRTADPLLLAAGFIGQGQAPAGCDQELVTEHVAYSHFVDYPGGLHPSEGLTQPYVSPYEIIKYSFCKAPRYNGRPAETGPLAQMLTSGHPLFADMIAAGGPNAYVRELARLTRPAELLPAMKTWAGEIDPEAPFYHSVREIPDGRGYGLIDASRGALGHWVEISRQKIAHYQIITPTAWNGSPRDHDGVRGPWEEALIGTPIADPDNPVEIGHVIRSFDACQVCSVHLLTNNAPATGRSRCVRV
ncbi:MAG: nickel-dependent hydrogenase large subunit [Desulfoprunum sp.]|uniref:nickel-dependent hydrogenase large subunit n=1 Tax=Desulfoprunum sp. TaxID=2020866 RepID=UPI003C70B60E